MHPTTLLSNSTVIGSQDCNEFVYPCNSMGIAKKNEDHRRKKIPTRGMRQPSNGKRLSESEHFSTVKKEWVG